MSTVDVTFSEPVDTTSLSSAALTLTDNGNAVAVSGVSLSLVSGTTYAVSDLSGFTAAEGSYALTINAADIEDESGNPGSGSLSTSWLMDTTPPTSSVNALPAQTTATSFTVSVTASDPAGAGGSPPSGVASIALYGSTDGGPFALFATVTPGSPSATFTGQAGDTYGFYGVATDNGGNIQPTPGAAQQTVQILPSMTVNSIAAVSPNPRNTAVPSVDVTFSVPIDTTSLAPGAIALSDDGQSVSTDGVSLALVSGTTYAIDGLSALTTAEGSYTLTVNAADITDTYGNPGTGSLSTSWLMDTTPPTSAIDALPAQTTTTGFTVSVTASDPPGADGSPALRRGLHRHLRLDRRRSLRAPRDRRAGRSVHRVHRPGGPDLRLLQHRH